jgi:hypothetical protein
MVENRRYADIAAAEDGRAPYFKNTPQDKVDARRRFVCFDFAIGIADFKPIFTNTFAELVCLKKYFLS